MDSYLQLATMSRWYVVSRCIHTVSRLGIANFMSSDQAMSAQELAQLTQTQGQWLDRILDYLCGYDIFKKQAEGYTLTPSSEHLRDDNPRSLRAVFSMVDEYWWQAFSQMEESLKTGIPAFDLQHQDNFFSFLSKDSQRQENFDQGMAKLSSYDDPIISASYDFSQFDSICDMGAGFGGLSLALHHAYPKLAITVFDTIHVIKQLYNRELPPQISLVAGDFLKEIPQTAAYIFKGVLHDFSDEMMRQILSNCAQRMPKKATLLIAEQVMPEENSPHPNKTMDIVMMVLLGGRQRRLAEWQKSVELCGFTFKQAYPTKSLFTIMEFILTER